MALPPPFSPLSDSYIIPACIQSSASHLTRARSAIKSRRAQARDVRRVLTALALSSQEYFLPGTA